MVYRPKAQHAAGVLTFSQAGSAGAQGAADLEGKLQLVKTAVLVADLAERQSTGPVMQVLSLPSAPYLSDKCRAPSGPLPSNPKT